MDFTIHHVAISAVDMAESVAFYEQFGFRVVDSIHEAKNFVENLGIASNIEIQHGRTGVPRRQTRTLAAGSVTGGPGSRW